MINLLSSSQSSPTLIATKALIASIGYSCYRECRTRGLPWALSGLGFGEPLLSVRSSSSASAHVLRSVFLLYGRQITRMPLNANGSAMPMKTKSRR